jgi:hypothetical protein
LAVDKDKNVKKSEIPAGSELVSSPNKWRKTAYKNCIKIAKGFF